MRRFLIRLAIALVAFIVGVTAAAVFGGIFGQRAQRRCPNSDSEAYVAPPPMPAEYHSCPAHQFEIRALPVPPAPPAAPEPPKFERRMRIRVRAADGAVREVEIKTVKDAEQ
jgi:hypothetical protein